MKFNDIGETKDISELGKNADISDCKLDDETEKKFEHLMGDDEISEEVNPDISEKKLENEEELFEHLMGDDEIECDDDGIEDHLETENDPEEKDPEKESTEVESEKKELTSEQKKEIKEKTGWSDEIIDSIGSMDEAEIYMKANLVETEINGKKCLIRNDIDIDQKDEDGITNRERMERGRPPITKNGEEVELHHIGQKPDSPLAELTMEEHRGAGNDTILHDKTKETEIDRNEFGKERREHWKDRVNVMEGAE